jgi:hypothetical protein
MLYSFTKYEGSQHEEALQRLSVPKTYPDIGNRRKK